MSVNGQTAPHALATAKRLPLARLHFTNEPTQVHAVQSALLMLPYEILEAVLLHLPTRDLLLSQRICQRFRYMVESSKPVRRTLFLEPAHHNGQLDDWPLLKFNPFLTNQLAGSFHTRAIGVHRGKDGIVKMVAHMRYEKEALLDDDWAEIILYEHASWKSMLVSQPPATLLMHPSASLFWKTAMEQRAQFWRDDAGFTILDALGCADW
ncbi:hypothetical protein DPSP01_005671 [Paraphaeosphaeria sporulosa]|uniref:F-box domain-containing protein n=1 Tax=Paraphaeosphaeria sporulosa TaxID=1460663 RepID=A0A177CS73_9PLEO|nr:uncharacterized protein CC84DRAFT_1202854 [Paraphaeosphaeria sporulosa]OAG10383.1 hypothetical protein CC84DRAFT_1202854 [Paraphaeosphaeria sporulosa]